MQVHTSEPQAALLHGCQVGGGGKLPSPRPASPRRPARRREPLPPQLALKVLQLSSHLSSNVLTFLNGFIIKCPDPLVGLFGALGQAALPASPKPLACQLSLAQPLLACVPVALWQACLLLQLWQSCICREAKSLCTSQLANCLLVRAEKEATGCT